MECLLWTSCVDTLFETLTSGCRQCDPGFTDGKAKPGERVTCPRQCSQKGQKLNARSVRSKAPVPPGSKWSLGLQASVEVTWDTSVGEEPGILGSLSVNQSTPALTFYNGFSHKTSLYKGSVTRRG